MDHELLLHVLSILAVSTAAIAVCQRLGMSPVLGYLATGIVVGPHVFAWLPDPAQTQALAELGVVLLMFTVGLEFSWSRLLAAKRLVLGLGGTQVVVTTLLFGSIAWWLDATPAVALIIGAALALSSTAIVLKQLSEQSELVLPHGHVAFGILLFQDIAAIPFLVILPILAADQAHIAGALIWALLKAGLLLAALIVIGRRMLPPVLHWVAGTYSQELFMATTLVIALAAAGLSVFLGLSATLGAFMAGTLLGETLFRHQIEADIRPFRDLMLGVFFITIGMQLDLQTLTASPLGVLATFGALVTAKTVILAPLIRAFGHLPFTAWRAAISLGQGGEFGLLLVSLGLGLGLINRDVGQPILVGLVFSMVLAPLLVRFNGALGAMLSGRMRTGDPVDVASRIAEASAGLDGHVILCGYGRVGQNLAWLLAQEGIATLALDLNPERVKQAGAAGERVLYGDAMRHENLDAAGIDRARALAITFDDAAAAERITTHIHHRHSHLPILVRSVHGRDDATLLASGAEVFPEGLEASLAFAGQLLVLLGIPSSRVEARLSAIRAEAYAPLRAFFHDSQESRKQASDYPEQVRTVVIDEGHHAMGRTLGEIGLSEPDMEIKAVRRGSLWIPVGQLDTRLRVGDVLVFQGVPEAIDGALAHVVEGSAGTVQESD